MKFNRSMVLVSNDPESMRKGAGEIYNRFQTELKAFGLSEEIALSQLADNERVDALPLVIIYPEASAYGPVTWAPIGADGQPITLQQTIQKAGRQISRPYCCTSLAIQAAWQTCIFCPVMTPDMVIAR